MFDDDYHKKARDRMGKARAEDPEKFRNRKRRFYAEHPEYRQAIIGRIRQRRRDNPARYLWEKARRRARNSGLEFSITVEEIVIPTHCPALGIPIKALSETVANGISLDRIDNKRGYVTGNVAVISRRANSIKSDATMEELEALVQWLKGHS